MSKDITRSQVSTPSKDLKNRITYAQEGRMSLGTPLNKLGPGPKQ